MTASYADRYNILPVVGSHPTQRTADTGQPSMKHMRRAPRRFDLAMVQQPLNRSKV